MVGEPAPLVAGTSQSYNLTGLSASTAYYFAIKTADEVFNWSGLSNLPDGTTTGGDDEAETVALHPSGVAAGDEMLAYTGGTADTVLDTNDSDSSYGELDRDQNHEARLEIEDSSTTGDIKSVQVKAVVKDLDSKSDDQLRLGLLICGNEYWGPIIQDVSNSYTTYEGTLHRNNPDTATTWTWSDIDNLAAMVDDFNGQSRYRITELYVEVGSYTPDVIAPDDISDLATGTVGKDSVQLTWTAPGDDNNIGTASEYDVRYSTSLITDGNWDSATQATGEPSPQEAGLAESFTVTGLTAGTTYYFAIKTSDEVPNISSLSNVVSVMTRVDHFRIDHSGSGLTCQRADVTVKACQNADCSVLVSEPVGVTLSPSGWIGGSNQTITSGSKAFQLRHTSPGFVTLAVAGSTPSAAGADACFVGGAPASCSLEFSSAGFIFDVADQTSCETSASVTISAVKSSDAGQKCIADGGFANQSKTVNFWSSYVSPGTGSQAVKIGGSSIAGSSPGTGINLSFDGNAESSFTVAYDDAGELQLTARYQGSGEEAGLVMTGSDTFVVVPDHFNITVTSDGSTPLDYTTNSGTPSWIAGEDFYAKVEAVCSNDTVTANFAAPTSLSAVAPFAPGTGTLGTLSNGSITSGTFSSGSATVNNLSYDEVGTVTLQADSSDYLGSGVNITGTSSTVGRFTPGHFDVSLNSPSFAAGCGTFTYLGQPFTYSTAPVITVTAKNKAGTTTQNYTGSWWQITDASLTGKAYSVASGSLDTSLVPSPDPVIVDSGSGVGTLTFSDGGGLAFSRSNPVAPFDAEIAFAVNVINTDGISYASNPARFGTATAGNGIGFSGGKSMRFGRLQMENAHGSELLGLSVPIVAEYYNGTVWTTNTDDTCSSLALSQFTLTSEVESVTATSNITIKASSTSSPSLTGLSSGAGSLDFTAPSPAIEGNIDIDSDLTSLYWLRFDWDGDASHDDDPTARSTFGIHKGDEKMIFLRESILY